MTTLRPPKWVYILFLIGAMSLIIRALLDSRFDNTAILYVLIPFITSFLIFHLTPPPQDSSIGDRLWRHLRSSTIIMLGTSAILFEGFICVLFFMPIYYFIVLITFGFKAWRESRKESQNYRLKSSVLPLVIGVLALEGVTPSTTFERQNSVTRTMIINADIDTLKSNMAQPIILPSDRHWFLSVFPLPVNIKAGTLAAGDIHSLDFVYKRWFFTNVKRGRMELLIDSVEPQQVTTKIVRNDSYLAGYLNIKGTEVNFTLIKREAGAAQTRVDLTVKYDRLLDPVWYFGPLQNYAVEQSADYLLRSVIAKNNQVIRGE